MPHGTPCYCSLASSSSLSIPCFAWFLSLRFFFSFLFLHSIIVTSIQFNWGSACAHAFSAIFEHGTHQLQSNNCSKTEIEIWYFDVKRYSVLQFACNRWETSRMKNKKLKKKSKPNCYPATNYYIKNDKVLDVCVHVGLWLYPTFGNGERPANYVHTITVSVTSINLVSFFFFFDFSSAAFASHWWVYPFPLCLPCTLKLIQQL